MGLSLLTDEEIQLLQGALDKIRQERGNLPPRPPMERSFDEAEDHQAPETYIAKPQTTDGIPGLDGTEPGKADCDVYKIIMDDITGDPELQLIGLDLSVYNTNTGSVSQKYIPVSRTKFGKWLTISSSGFLIEWAILDETLSEGNTAIASIYRGGPKVEDLVDSGEDVTVGAPPLMGSDTGTGTDVGTVASGSWVLITQMADDYWWVIGVPCP